MSSVFDFLTDNRSYENLKEGWNTKLLANTAELSGLTPFVSLYVVLDKDDLYYSQAENIKTVQDRFTLVNFKTMKNRELAAAKPAQALISPIASNGHGQIEADSYINDYESQTSFKGAAGITDLSVIRGASGPLNIKFDVGLVLPNPELINQLYEYSKIMILNTKFLLMYGWNVDSGLKNKMKNYAFPMSRVGDEVHVDLSNEKTAGFSHAQLVNLQKFDFSVDNVGHLVGKLSFLTMAGNVLISTKTNTLAPTMLKLLNDREAVLDENKDSDYPVIGTTAIRVDKIELDKVAGTEHFAYNFQTSGRLSRDFLTRSPRFGQDLQVKILKRWREKDNPNNKIFYNSQGGAQLFGENLDTETRAMLETTSVISAFQTHISPDTKELVNYLNAPATVENKSVEEYEKERKEMELAAETLQQDFLFDTGEALEKMIARPAYYFLGSVLEALSFALIPSGENNNDDAAEVSFIYHDIPLDDTDSVNGLDFPIPNMSKGIARGYKGQLEEIDNAITAIDDAFNKVGDATWGRDLSEALDANAELINVADAQPELYYVDANVDDKKLLTKSKAEEKFAEAKELKGFEKLPIQHKLDALGNFSEIYWGQLKIKNVFEIPVGILDIKRVLEAEGSAPLHKLIQKILAVAHKTMPAVRLSAKVNADNPTHFDISVINLRTDGMMQQVGNSLNLYTLFTSEGFSGNLDEGSELRQKIAALNSTGAQDLSSLNSNDVQMALQRYIDSNIVVMEFGGQNSLVENFNLSSKVDPMAFATFRLPQVIGGKEVNIADWVGNAHEGDVSTYDWLYGEISRIIKGSTFHAHKELETLKIISSTKGEEGKEKWEINDSKLKEFLKLGRQDATPAVGGRRRVMETFISNLQTDPQFNAMLMHKQKEKLEGKSNSFYGSILSSFLKTINLTIHGTVGFSQFNVIYIKGLLRGIEGLYLVTNVTDSLSPANFTTNLECKLVSYTYDDQNKGTQTANSFQQFVSEYDKVDKDGNESFAELLDQVNKNIRANKQEADWYE